MTVSSADAGAAAPKPVYGANYKRLVLFLLVAAYTLNFIDRTIIATLGQPIKDTLHITDGQLGLLGGLYFALLYTLLGIPIARLAERFSRVNIITGGDRHLVGVHRALRYGGGVRPVGGLPVRGGDRRGGSVAAGPLADQRLL